MTIYTRNNEPRSHLYNIFINVEETENICTLSILVSNLIIDKTAIFLSFIRWLYNYEPSCLHVQTIWLGQTKIG